MACHTPNPPNPTETPHAVVGKLPQRFSIAHNVSLLIHSPSTHPKRPHALTKFRVPCHCRICHMARSSAPLARSPCTAITCWKALGSTDSLARGRLALPLPMVLLRILLLVLCQVGMGVILLAACLCSEAAAFALTTPGALLCTADECRPVGLRSVCACCSCGCAGAGSVWGLGAPFGPAAAGLWAGGPLLLGEGRCWGVHNSDDGSTSDCAENCPA